MGSALLLLLALLVVPMVEVILLVGDGSVAIDEVVVAVAARVLLLPHAVDKELLLLPPVEPLKVWLLLISRTCAGNRR